MKSNEKDNKLKDSKMLLFGKTSRSENTIMPADRHTSHVEESLDDRCSEDHSSACRPGIAGDTFENVTKNKMQFLKRFYLRSLYFFACALMIKYMLAIYTPYWMIIVYNSFKEYPAFHFASELSSSIITGGYLLLFHYLSIILLFFWGLFNGLTLNYLEITASYLLVVKKVSWSKSVFLAILAIVLMAFFTVNDFLNPNISEGYSTRILGSIYYDDLGSLFAVYIYIVPGVAMTFVEGIIIFISMLLYKLSEEFKYDVHSVTEA